MAAAGTASFAQNGSCSGNSVSGQKWTGADSGGNTSLTFESADRFQYTVRSGARTMVSARGQFSIRKSNERADITITPVVEAEEAAEYLARKFKQS
jgi:hypothetical protein